MAIAANIQVPNNIEKFAVYSEDPKIPIIEKVVPVPPFNRTLEDARKLGKEWGWVGFNVSLPNQGKPGYRAGGIMLYEPASKEKSTVLLRVVNETDFEFLIWSGMEEDAWNICKVYAEAYLETKKGYVEFQFKNLDNCQKYCLFFRGLDYGVEDTIILISIKEAWYEYVPWIPATPANKAIIGMGIISGLIFTTLGFKNNKKKKRLKLKKF
ncbi:MAG: hypothetical protein QXR45_08950 [Candidatus Bathyarchaeia archaeon]